MIKKIIFLFAFVMSSNLFAFDCPKPIINVEINKSETRLDTNASVLSLTQYTNGYGSTLGLYRANEMIRIMPTIRNRKINNSYNVQACIIKMDIQYNYSQVINIGNEFEPGSCGYNETLRHERTHEEIQYNGAVNATNFLKNELSKRNYFWSNTTMNEVNQWNDKMVKYVSSVFINYIDPVQAKFDKDEAQKFSRTCPDDFIKLHTLKRKR